MLLSACVKPVKTTSLQLSVTTRDTTALWWRSIKEKKKQKNNNIKEVGIKVIRNSSIHAERNEHPAGILCFESSSQPIAKRDTMQVESSPLNPNIIMLN